jgi:hypothetical protein
MTIWTNSPDEATTYCATKLLRVRPTHPITGVVTSHHLIGTHVHYWRGRSIPCRQEQCEACKDNRAARWYGWLSIFEPKSRAHAIVEVTAACEPPLADYARTHGQLRGALLTIQRATNKLNARLEASITESRLHPDVLPAELDVAHVLEHIWETHHGTHAPEAQQHEPTNGKLHLA